MNDIFTDFPVLIQTLEQQGLVTRTFRRLDPDRQQAILDAILEEAAENGPADLNVRQVAARAGVSVGSLYQYFGSRETLLNFAITLVARTTVDTFNAYLPYLTEMPLREALQAYLGGGLEWSQTQMGLVRFFARAAYQGDPRFAETIVRPIATTLTNAMRELLAAAQARGEIRADVDLEATARVVNTLMIAVGDAQLFPFLNNYYQLTGGGVDANRVLEAVLALIETGIAPEKPHETPDHHPQNAA